MQGGEFQPLPPAGSSTDISEKISQAVAQQAGDGWCESTRRARNPNCPAGRRQGPGHLKEDFRLSVLLDSHPPPFLVGLDKTPLRIIMR